MGGGGACKKRLVYRGVSEGHLIIYAVRGSEKCPAD